MLFAPSKVSPIFSNSSASAARSPALQNLSAMLVFLVVETGFVPPSREATSGVRS